MEIDTLLAEAILASEETLPRIGQSPASFAGRTFHYGVEAPERRGVFVLVFEYENRIHPLYVGEGRSIRSAIAEALSERDALRRLTHGFYWAPTASDSDSHHLARHLILALQPHFNAVEAQRSNTSTTRTANRKICLRSHDADDTGHAACQRHARMTDIKRPGYAPSRPATRSPRRIGWAR